MVNSLRISIQVPLQTVFIQKSHYKYYLSKCVFLCSSTACVEKYLTIVFLIWCACYINTTAWGRPLTKGKWWYWQTGQPLVQKICITLLYKDATLNQLHGDNSFPLLPTSSCNLKAVLFFLDLRRKTESNDVRMRDLAFYQNNHLGAFGVTRSDCKQAEVLLPLFRPGNHLTWVQ